MMFLETSKDSKHNLDANSKKVSSCKNFLVINNHNLTQSIEYNKENIHNYKNNVTAQKMVSIENQNIDDTNGAYSIDESSLSDKSVSEGCVKNIPDSQINPLKKFIEGNKIQVIQGNKQSKKLVKKIKQSSIKRAKDHHVSNFGAKIANSVKNAGTSRISYNKIFYANNSKSSLKNYTNALKTCNSK